VVIKRDSLIFRKQKIVHQLQAEMQSVLQYDNASANHRPQEKPIVQLERNTIGLQLVEFGIPLELVSLIKVYLNETYGKVHIGDNFQIRNGLNQARCFIDIDFQLCLRICHYEGPGKPSGVAFEWDTSVFGLC
jgi:hypothetical protein